MTWGDGGHGPRVQALSENEFPSDRLLGKVCDSLSPCPQFGVDARRRLLVSADVSPVETAGQALRGKGLNLRHIRPFFAL